jgi:predicted nuclease of predicted toxin-antitoxin system
VKVLLDENLPNQLRRHLAKHETATVVYMGWGGWKNGALLAAAEEAGFDVLVTGDLSLEYQQNMFGREIAVVSLSTHNWRIVRHHVQRIAAAVDQARSGSLVRVECGRFVRPRNAPKGTAPG